MQSSKLNAELKFHCRALSFITLITKLDKTHLKLFSENSSNLLLTNLSDSKRSPWNVSSSTFCISVWEISICFIVPWRNSVEKRKSFYWILLCFTSNNFVIYNWYHHAESRARDGQISSGKAFASTLGCARDDARVHRSVLRAVAGVLVGWVGMGVLCRNLWNLLRHCP